MTDTMHASVKDPCSHNASCTCAEHQKWIEYDRRHFRHQRNEAIVEALRAGVGFDDAVNVLRTVSYHRHYPDGFTNAQVHAEFLEELDENDELIAKQAAELEEARAEAAELRSLINRR